MAQFGSTLEYSLRAAGEQLERQSRQIDDILRNESHNQNNDYSLHLCSVGLIVIAGSFGLQLIGMAPAFAVAALGFGAAFVCGGMYVRHKAAVRKAEFDQSLVDLDRERAHANRRMVVIHHLLTAGLPKGLTAEDIPMLMGDDTDSQEWIS